MVDITIKFILIKKPIKRQLYSVLRLDIVQRWVIIIMTCKIAFAAVDSVLSLKILDAGVPKEKLALLAVPLTPIQIVMPIFLAPFTTGDQPLNLWLRAYIPRIALGVVLTIFVYFTPAMLQVNTLIWNRKLNNLIIFKSDF